MGQGLPVQCNTQPTTIKQVSTQPVHNIASINLHLNQLNLTHLPLVGRLKHCLTNWKLVCKDCWVLEAIRGYHIDFISPPFQAGYPPAIIHTPEESNLIENEVQELLTKGAIHPVVGDQRQDGFVSNLFLVPKKGGGQRPVINLKKLNQFVQYEHFKMENVRMLQDLLKKDDYLVKIDLKDAYFTVPIWVNHQKYLRFPWKENLYEFTCLPFGLSSAPRVFTKIMKPAVGLLRQLGIRIVIYLDDMMIMSRTQEVAKYHAMTAVNLLENLGFTINYQKSALVPTTSIEFLGFLVDSTTLTLSLPKEKIKKAKKACQSILDNPLPSIHQLSQLLGYLTSTIQAVFPAPIHFRYLQIDKNKALNACQDYSATLQLSQNAKEELVWWRDNLEAWNGKALVSGEPDLIIETDASRKGWGASCMGQTTGGRWSLQEQHLHINCLELLAGAFALKAFTKDKAQMRVRLLMDNTSAAHYINKMGGTKSLVLASLAKDLWEWCLDRQIVLEAQHIPGILNVEADRESRVFVDNNDWKLAPQVFDNLNCAWGPLEVDLFATRLSKQLPRFVSWRPDPEAESCNAWAQDWSKFKGYAFPPFSLVGRCLKQVLTQEVPTLVLVAPVWKTQPWYPLLLEMSVAQPRLLPLFPGLLTKQQEVHPLNNLQLAGWLVSANLTQQQVFQNQLKTCFSLRGEKVLQTLMPQLGENGPAGVVNGKLIQFVRI